jgi:hypothetical protein
LQAHRNGSADQAGDEPPRYGLRDRAGDEPPRYGRAESARRF